MWYHGAFKFDLGSSIVYGIAYRYGLNGHSLIHWLSIILTFSLPYMTEISVVIRQWT